MSKTAEKLETRLSNSVLSRFSLQKQEPEELPNHNLLSLTYLVLRSNITFQKERESWKQNQILFWILKSLLF